LLNVDIQSDRAAGGLAGLANATFRIVDSYVTGNISVGGGSHAGGLVGNGNPIIVNSYVLGTVTARIFEDEPFVGTDPQFHNIGGLVGLGNPKITNSYMSGKVIGLSESERLGGLVGHGNPIINSSYAVVEIEGGHDVGGLVGEGSPTINNSYAHATLGIVDGRGALGGLVGTVASGIATKITNSYAVSTISSRPESQAAGDIIESGIGGLVGLVDSGRPTITHSYWDTEVSTITRVINRDSITRTYTTAQLQSPTAPNAINPDRYTDWSIETWDFGTREQYPILAYGQPDPDKPEDLVCRDPQLRLCRTGEDVNIR